MFAQVWEWGRLSAEGWGARDQGAGKQLLQEAGNAGRAAPRLDTVKVGHHLSATLWVVTHSLPVVPQSVLPISHQRILTWSSLPPTPCRPSYIPGMFPPTTGKLPNWGTELSPTNTTSCHTRVSGDIGPPKGRQR